MFRCFWNAIGLLAGVILVCVAPAQGQDWAKKMFNATSHDFGVIARGAKVEYKFIVENIYEEDAHIKSVTTSCGCAKPKISKQDLKTWEKAEILVSIDTKSFLGRKDPVVVVVFDLPYQAEVYLSTHAYIRSDIVVQPGVVQLGTVAQGAGANQTVAVTYAGRDDWKIEKVECANPNLEATAVETNRGSGQVAYNLSVKLKPDAPAGYIQDQVTLVTNDVNTRVARVPVSVEGVVSSAITIRPSPLPLGQVEAGRSVTRNLVIQGRSPFRILAATSNDDRFQCKIPTDSKTVHIVPVTFYDKNTQTPSGTLNAKLTLKTDLPEAKSVETGVTVQVTPP